MKRRKEILKALGITEADVTTVKLNELYHKDAKSMALVRELMTTDAPKKKIKQEDND